MLIAIDGGCKRNGKPDCVSMGVAWLHSGNIGFLAKLEECSTNQRGEINGLINALEYASRAEPGEDVIIITDSEYLYNTVEKRWYEKWRTNNWRGASGDTVKNVDMWKRIAVMLDALENDGIEVYMQWTKGHLISYTPTKIRQALEADQSAVELMMRITTVASRPMDKDRIIDDFIYQRKKHGYIVPPREVCFDWAVANTVADCLASYLAQKCDELLIEQSQIN